MFNYGQPFTHIGLLTTLHVTDKINLFNGTINGWDRFFNEHYKWGYIGGFAATSQRREMEYGVYLRLGSQPVPQPVTREPTHLSDGIP